MWKEAIDSDAHLAAHGAAHSQQTSFLAPSRWMAPSSGPSAGVAGAATSASSTPQRERGSAGISGGGGGGGGGGYTPLWRRLTPSEAVSGDTSVPPPPPPPQTHKHHIHHHSHPQQLQHQHWQEEPGLAKQWKEGGPAASGSVSYASSAASGALPQPADPRLPAAAIASFAQQQQQQQSATPRSSLLDAYLAQELARVGAAPRRDGSDEYRRVEHSHSDERDKWWRGSGGGDGGGPAAATALPQPPPFAATTTATTTTGAAEDAALHRHLNDSHNCASRAWRTAGGGDAHGRGSRDVAEGPAGPAVAAAAGGVVAVLQEAVREERVMRVRAEGLLLAKEREASAAKLEVDRARSRLESQDSTIAFLRSQLEQERRRNGELLAAHTTPSGQGELDSLRGRNESLERALAEKDRELTDAQVRLSDATGRLRGLEEALLRQNRRGDAVAQFIAPVDDEAAAAPGKDVVRHRAGNGGGGGGGGGEQQLQHDALCTALSLARFVREAVTDLGAAAAAGGAGAGAGVRERAQRVVRGNVADTAALAAARGHTCSPSELLSDIAVHLAKAETELVRTASRLLTFPTRSGDRPSSIAQVAAAAAVHGSTAATASPPPPASSGGTGQSQNQDDHHRNVHGSDGNEWQEQQRGRVVWPAVESPVSTVKLSERRRQQQQQEEEGVVRQQGTMPLPPSSSPPAAAAAAAASGSPPARSPSRALEFPHDHHLDAAAAGPLPSASPSPRAVADATARAGGDEARKEAEHFGDDGEMTDDASGAPEEEEGEDEASRDGRAGAAALSAAYFTRGIGRLPSSSSGGGGNEGAAATPQRPSARPSIYAGGSTAQWPSRSRFGDAQQQQQRQQSRGASVFAQRQRQHRSQRQRTRNSAENENDCDVQ